MPNIDLKYARSNTTGTSEQAREEGGETGAAAASCLAIGMAARPSVVRGRPSGLAGCSSEERTTDARTDADGDGRIRHEIVGKDILREKPLLSISLAHSRRRQCSGLGKKLGLELRELCPPAGQR